MRYETEILIKAPLETTRKHLESVEDMPHWQRGFKKYEHLSGEPGQPGSKARIHFDMGKRSLVLTETVIANELPHHLTLKYETKGVINHQEHFLEETAEGHTRWKTQNEFVFEGLGMKLMGWLMPGAFKKQSLQYMTDFRNFVENGTSVRDATH